MTHSMRHLSKLPTILLVAGLVLGFAAGCAGTSAAKQSATTAPPHTATSSSSTLPPATSTTIAPLPDTTGTDLVKVMRNLDLLLDLAAERVDLSLLDLIYTPTADDRKVTERQLRELQANGWHYDESVRSVITDISVKTPIDGAAIVDVTDAMATQVVKDVNGQIAKTGQGWAPRRERYGLLRGTDGHWRIHDFNILGPA